MKIQENRDNDPIYQQWKEAQQAYENGEYNQVIVIFDELGKQTKNAKFLFNKALAEIQKREYESALGFLTKAIKADKFLAAAWFVRGTCQHFLEDLPLAILDYTKTLEVMRDNRFVTYAQLGNKFILHRAEVLYNRGIALLQLNLCQRAAEDLALARLYRSSDSSHNIISEIADQTEALRGTGAGELFTYKDLLKQTSKNAQKSNGNPLMESMQAARARLRKVKKNKDPVSS